MTAGLGGSGKKAARNHAFGRISSQYKIFIEKVKVTWWQDEADDKE